MRQLGDIIFKFVLLQSKESLEDEESEDDSKKLMEEEKGTFECSEEQSTFKSQGKSNFECEECGVVFDSLNLLNSHKVIHLFTTKFSCSKCEENFDTAIEVETHSAVTHFYCDLCSVDHNSKKNLTNHYQTLTHLEKAKKMLEEKSHNFMLSDEVKEALAKTPLSPRPDTGGSGSGYKCNICCIGFSGPSTLDGHLNSLSHSLQLNRLPELVSSGEVSADLPVFTTPEDDSTRKVSESKNSIGSTLLNEKAFASMVKEHQQQQNAIAVFNMLGGLNQLVSNNNSNSSTTNSLMANKNCAMESNPFPSNSVDFVDMLNVFGFSEITDQIAACGGEIDSIKTKIVRLSSETIEEISKVDCSTCHISFPSILALRLHHQKIHFDDDIPTDVVVAFCERLRRALILLEDKENSQESRDDGVDNSKDSSVTSSLKRKASMSPGPNDVPDSIKRIKEEEDDEEGNGEVSQTSSASSTPKLDTADRDYSNLENLTSQNPLAMDINSRIAMVSMLNNFNMFTPQMMSMLNGSQDLLSGNSVTNPLSINPLSSSSTQSLHSLVNMANASANSPQKRARTRITDDQLKILRQYFDINNSPSEVQIKEMSVKAGLAEKVIKHWFRNTLFKERQRDKDSPYNFNVPPQMGIDLDAYEKTGETKVVALKREHKDLMDDEDEKSTNSTSSLLLSFDKESSVTNDTKLTAGPSSSLLISGKEKSDSIINEGGINSLPSLLSTVTSSQLNSSTSNTPSIEAMFHGNALAAAAAAMQNPFALFFNNALRPPTDMLASLNPLAMSGSNLSTNSSSSSANTPSHNSQNNSMPMSSASGRRANRTRFTDFQLRTMREFFLKQPYPKDDDLEMLSKKLQLSPRVIVVWFQNSRQGKRKMYEKHNVNDNSNDRIENRYVKTPGANFQCKRCNIVFQRYYELIQHQHNSCYKDDDQSLKKDNKFVDENLSENDKAEASSMSSQLMSIVNGASLLGNTGIDALLAKKLNATATESTPSQDDFFQMIAKDKSEAMLNLFKSKERESLFRKRCMICKAPFYSKETLTAHINANHSEIPLLSCFTLDSYPDITEDDEDNSGEENANFSAANPFSMLSTFPLDLSTTLQRNGSDGNNSSDTEDNTVEYSVSNSISPGGTTSTRAPRSLSHLRSTSPSSMNNSKRYRTHLSPLQVHVMTSIFNDYKTPSMAECEALGASIGLHKRVVQVYFQNKRASRKKRASGLDDSDAAFLESTSQKCDLCNVNYNQTNTSMQDHIFTAQHINKIKSLSSDNSESSPSFKNSLASLLEKGEGRSSGSGSKKKTSADRGETPATIDPALSFSLMYGLGNAGFPNMMMGQNLFGTPIKLLQINESVMAQINSDIDKGAHSTVFTQDGLPYESLESKVSPIDFKCSLKKNLETGWCCISCRNVFQSNELLKNHQQLVCTGVDTVFKLIQTHIECSKCESRFGSQVEYKAHCETPGHVSARNSVLLKK
uniref:Homeobox domain-containing protein n=1 Tax=Rhabditophanes sp. KR3021 TaxID=114890 RepID=A0AC35TS12_9BILA